jgi:hypothetical protein
MMMAESWIAARLKLLVADVQVMAIWRKRAVGARHRKGHKGARWRGRRPEQSRRRAAGMRERRPDLVGDDEDGVRETEVAEAREFGARPDATDRIVRVTQQQNAGPLSEERRFEGGKINFVSGGICVPQKRDVDQATAVGADDVEKRIVHRRKHGDGVPGREKARTQVASAGTTPRAWQTAASSSRRKANRASSQARTLRWYARRVQRVAEDRMRQSRWQWRPTRTGRRQSRRRRPTSESRRARRTSPSDQVEFDRARLGAIHLLIERQRRRRHPSSKQRCFVAHFRCPPRLGRRRRSSSSMCAFSRVSSQARRCRQRPRLARDAELRRDFERHGLKLAVPADIKYKDERSVCILFLCVVVLICFFVLNFFFFFFDFFFFFFRSWFESIDSCLPLRYGARTKGAQIANNAFVAPCATVVGSVEVWDEASVW